MQLGYTILYVQDVKATLAFYEAAFGLTTRFLHDSGDYGAGDATQARYELTVAGEPLPVLLVDVDREQNPGLSRPTHGPQRIVPA